MRPDLTAALRRLALAVSLLHDVDLSCGDDGLRLAGVPGTVPWGALAAAALPGRPVGAPLDADDLDPARLRPRLAAQLRVLQAAAGAGRDGLAAAVLPLGLPVGHHDHPGPAWVRTRVPGGALDLGLGLPQEGAPGPLALTPWALGVLGGPAPDELWAFARLRLEAAGRRAAQRLPRDGGVLRPVGGCDVVTLLGARALRRALAAADPLGMPAVAVPARRRGWTDLRHLDPAFARAAAAATDPADRGFDGPLLVTADEVVAARAPQPSGEPTVPVPRSRA